MAAINDPTKQERKLNPSSFNSKKITIIKTIPENIETNRTANIFNPNSFIGITEDQ
jgi:hypothetical protein